MVANRKATSPAGRETESKEKPTDPTDKSSYATRSKARGNGRRSEPSETDQEDDHQNPDHAEGGGQGGGPIMDPEVRNKEENFQEVEKEGAAKADPV